MTRVETSVAGQRGSAKVAVILVLVVIVVLVPAGVLALLFAGRGKMVEVPDLKGNDLPTAQKELVTRGLAAGKIAQVGSLDFKPGRVVAQQFAPGAKVKRGTAVGLSVCKGPFVFVPDVAGMKAEAAGKELAAAMLVPVPPGPGEIVPSAEMEQGFVLSTKPEKETEALAGTKVTLVVSAGDPSQLAGGFQRPTASVGKIAMGEVGESSFTIRASLAISNPNPVDVTVKTLSYGVTAEGVPLGRGKSSPGKAVPANGKATFALKLTVPFKQVPPVGTITLEKGLIKYWVRGYARVAAQGQEMTVPIGVPGTYKFPQLQQMVRYLRERGNI